MLRFALVALAVMSLSGCITSKELTPAQTQTLRDTCDALGTAHDTYVIARDGGVIKGPRVKQADAAFAGVATLCGNEPPKNIASAAVRVALALVTINAAIASK